MSLRTFFARVFSKKQYIRTDGTLDVKLLLLGTLTLMVVVFSIYFLAIKYVSAQGWDESVVVQRFIENFGVKGVALYVFIVDLFVLPLSPDLMWPFVMEWHPMVAILVMSISSVAGAYCAYLFGRLVGLMPPIKRWVLKNSGTHTEKLITKYGVGAIVVSGLTPLPFSSICTVAGIVKLRPLYVFLSSLIRFVRMGLYYLIFAGMIVIG